MFVSKYSKIEALTPNEYLEMGPSRMYLGLGEVIGWSLI